MERKIKIMITLYAIFLIALGIWLFQGLGSYLQKKSGGGLIISIFNLALIFCGIGLIMRKNIARKIALFQVGLITLFHTAFVLGVLKTQIETIGWKLFWVVTWLFAVYFIYFFTRSKVKEQFK